MPGGARSFRFVPGAFASGARPVSPLAGTVSVPVRSQRADLMLAFSLSITWSIEKVAGRCLGGNSR